MIKIAGVITPPDMIVLPDSNDSVQKEIINTMNVSSSDYEFASMDELMFELNLRKSIVTWAKNLDKSHFDFRVFTKSKCNTDFWEKTGEGGFRLRNGILPSDAIKDIFEHSSKYGTECSTAMVIIYYRAMLDVMSEDQFNKLYSEIYLMNWQHLDRDLTIYDTDKAPDRIPGDAGYFKNPDVNPLTPEWQGENVFYLGDDRYFGHGIGIKSAEGIIKSLNKNRKEDSSVSAFQMDFTRNPDFKELYKMR